MTTLDLNAIEPLEPGGLGRRGRRRSALRGGARRPGVTRRSFIGGAGVAAAAIGTAGLFQRAAAHTTGSGGDYNILGGCGGGAYPNCGGCVTAGRIIGGCKTSGSYTGYHRHSHPTYDLRPDLCPQGGISGFYDGWTWSHGNCCLYNAFPWSCKKWQTWRCHDGYINGSASICRWRIGTGTSCSGC